MIARRPCSGQSPTRLRPVEQTGYRSRRGAARKRSALRTVSGQQPMTLVAEVSKETFSRLTPHGSNPIPLEGGQPPRTNSGIRPDHLFLTFVSHHSIPTKRRPLIPVQLRRRHSWTLSFNGECAAGQARRFAPRRNQGEKNFSDTSQNPRTIVQLVTDFTSTRTVVLSSARICRILSRR